MRQVIAGALERLSPEYSDSSGFVPQSRLWSVISDPDGEFARGSDQPPITFGGFLSALYGSQLSLEVFESVEDEHTGECWVRLRSDLATARITKSMRSRGHLDGESKEVEELQKTVRDLRTEVAILEGRNHALSASLEAMKAELPLPLQQGFDHLREIHSFIEQVSRSLANSEAEVLAIANGLPG
jgi:hypothetical protein